MIDWTAVATIAAAVAAFLSWLQSWRSHLASIRPVLIFKDWEYNPAAQTGVVLRAAKLENVGQGPALFVSVKARVTNVESTQWIGDLTSIRPSTEKVGLTVNFNWPVKTDTVNITVKMTYSDADSNSYETRLAFRARRDSAPKQAKWTRVGYLPDGLDLLTFTTRLTLIPNWVKNLDKPKSYPDEDEF